MRYSSSIEHRRLIDDILLALEANEEQRAEIKKACNDLAERLKKSQMRNCLLGEGRDYNHYV